MKETKKKLTFGLNEPHSSLGPIQSPAVLLLLIQTPYCPAIARVPSNPRCMACGGDVATV
jgi:hypothetical protein